MAAPKRYIHDRLILFLLTVNVFLTALIVVSVGLALTGGTHGVYTIEHRPSLGLSANRSGNATEMSSFIVFVVLVLAFNIFLSIRVYPLRRYFAMFILATGTLLLVLSGQIVHLLLKR